MNTPSNIGNKPEASFINGSRGKLFTLYYPTDANIKGAFLLIPPFAEEMNRCRSTAAKQAQELNKLGYACLLLDPYGTGDSAGDLVDATWETWVADISIAADWLNKKTNNIILWGIRLGALIAADAANTNPDRFKHLLLWQPTLDGKMFLTQHLRLRVAYLMDRGLPTETTNQMREALASGKNIEVAGYEISSKLTNIMDKKKIANYENLSNTHIHWLEHVSETEKPMTIITKKTITKLTEQGCKINPITFTGPPIWQLHKRDEIPELINTTLKLYQ